MLSQFDLASILWLLLLAGRDCCRTSQYCVRQVSSRKGQPTCRGIVLGAAPSGPTEHGADPCRRLAACSPQASKLLVAGSNPPGRIRIFASLAACDSAKWGTKWGTLSESEGLAALPDARGLQSRSLPSRLIPHRHCPRAELQPPHELPVDTLR